MIRKSRVLVIGDEGKGVEALVELLERSGHEALGLTRPLETLSRARELRPDLILLDYDPKEVGGPELAVLLRRGPETRDIPLVFTSDRVDEERLLLAALSGARGFVRLPATAESVLEEVDALLRAAPV